MGKLGPFRHQRIHKGDTSARAKQYEQCSPCPTLTVGKRRNIEEERAKVSVHTLTFIAQSLSAQSK